MTPEQLKAWRATAGLSQERLSALLDVDHMTVSRWERGLRELPPYLDWTLRGIRCMMVDCQYCDSLIAASNESF